MPGLDLLTEEELHLVGVFGAHEGKDGVVDGVEHFGGELGLEVNGKCIGIVLEYSYRGLQWKQMKWEVRTGHT